MKKIEAVIKPFKLEELQNALDEIGIQEMTVCEVKAFGRQKAHAEVFRGTQFPVASLPEIKIELVLPDNRLDAAVAAITKGARISEDKVLVSQINCADHSRVERLESKAA